MKYASINLQNLFLSIPVAALLVISLFFIKDVRFESSYKAFFDRDNPLLTEMESIQEEFSSIENSAIIILDHGDEGVYNKRSIKIISVATELANQLAGSIKVESLTTVDNFSNENDEIYISLIIDDPDNITNEQVKRARQSAKNNLLVRNRLVSDDEKVSAVLVEYSYPEEDQAATIQKIGDDLFRLSEKLSKDHNVKVYITGSPFYDYTLNNTMFSDALINFPAICLITALVLILFLRSIALTLIASCITGLSVLFVAGASGLLGVSINIISSLSFMTVVGLAMADCIHVFTTYMAELEKGAKPRDAMDIAIRKNNRAMFLTSLTTAVGFLSMNLSEIPPFRDLGNLTALGVVFDYLATVTFLPLCARFGLTPSKASKIGFNFRAPLVSKITNANPIYVSLVLFLSLLLSGASFINVLNDDTLDWFKPDTNFGKANLIAGDKLSGIRNVMFKLDSDESNGIYKTDFLNSTNQFVAWLSDQPEVIHVYSYTEVLKEINALMLDSKAMDLPNNRELAAQLGLIYEMSRQQTSIDAALFNVDKSALRVVVSLRNLNNTENIQFERRAYQWLTENAPAIAARGTSISLIFATVGQDNIEQMVYGGIGVLIFITISIAIALKSIKLALISILPNVLPLSITYGLWGIFVGELNVAAAVVFSVVIGIVVDDSIHLLSKYQKHLSANPHNPIASLQYAFDNSCGAIFVTSLILCCSFLVVYTSSFVMTSNVGIISAISIFLALSFDFFILPIIVFFLERHRQLR